MHGLAFAALLGPLDLGRGSLVTELLGFNLWIEVAQLVVVALVMPSLIVLSRSRGYPPLRAALAGLGVVLAGGWLAQRTGLVSADLFDGLTDTLVGHPLVVPAALALAAAATLFHQRRRPFARAAIDLVEDHRRLVAAPTTTGRRDGGRPRHDPWEAP